MARWSLDIGSALEVRPKGIALDREKRIGASPAKLGWTSMRWQQRRIFNGHRHATIARIYDVRCVARYIDQWPRAQRP